VEIAIEHSTSGAEPEAFNQTSGMSCSVLEDDDGGHLSNN